MYKLFLTIRYLTRKKIVLFPILVVWLCLMMMIIVTSIMGGFVDRVRQTNRDVLGDIIISSENASGWADYEDLQAKLRAKFPEIVGSTPVVVAHGLANVPSAGQTVPVEVMGIDPAGRSQVSRFRETLFKEFISPHEAAEDLSAALPTDREGLKVYAHKRYDAAEKEAMAASAARGAAFAAGGPGTGFTAFFNRLNYWWLWGLVVVWGLLYAILRRRPGRTGWSVVWGGLLGVVGLAVVLVGVLWPVIFTRQFELAEDRQMRALQAVSRAERTAAQAARLPEGRYQTPADIVNKLVPPEPSFEVSDPNVKTREGCIVGVQMGFFPRDKRGNFNRTHSHDFTKVFVTVFPASGATGGLSVNRSVTKPFTIVDDSYTGVFDIDLTALYVPFETAQIMGGMRADPEIVKDNADADYPPRTNEVLIKLRAGTSANEMKLARARISDFVLAYQDEHPDMDPFGIKVQTWDERQARYLGAVENEKVMQIVILGIMSLVVLVVIFLIFYMIVRDKTRDIGIIKAIGGSEEGVAGIFLIYGLFIGVVGGLLGVISGVAFVTHTNEIHEWIYQMTGIVIWDRSVYLFDRIPDTVHPTEVAIYFGLALLAGVVGALIPAIVAGSEDPVKAVRYE